MMLDVDHSLTITLKNKAEDKLKVSQFYLQSETDNEKLLFSVKEAIYSDLTLSL